MDGSDVAFAAFRRGKTAGAADIEQLERNPLALQAACNDVEPDAMAADDHQIRQTMRAADELDLDRRSGGEALHLLADRDEPVGLAEGGDRPRALGDRIGGERAVGARATSDTIRNSVRPRSEATRIGSVASIRSTVSDGRPAKARITGATNSWKVKIAEVGNPGRTTIGLPPVTARQTGLPGFSATPCTTMPGSLKRATAL